MTIGLFILFLLPSGTPETIDTIVAQTLYQPLMEENIIIEKLDDFDSDPKNPTDDWYGVDKFWHFSVAFALTGSSYHLIHNRLNSPDPEALIMSLSTVFIFSVLKEFWDLARYNLFSYKDLFYDTLGMGAGYLVFIHDWDS
ncbi:MAG: hypothetical protein JXJ04_20100 [Spirochaetales bacterium]|nr:hypothetical protein [Spirochaetales bacterium]